MDELGRVGEMDEAAECLLRRAKARGDDMTLEERVRRIYGIEAPKVKDTGGVNP